MNDPVKLSRRSLEDLLIDMVDEFSFRLQNGEQPDIESYIQQYPDQASEIRESLEAVQTLHAMKIDDLKTDGGSAEETAPGVLGDFRIVREIGRGGMGVVYEAEQISLRRRVALKVLPYAAMLDSRRLQRFKNEAHAAAALHHNNIVHVYSIGSERSVHYYAMQFIEGQTLAEIIKDLQAFENQDQPTELGKITAGSFAEELASGVLPSAEPEHDVTEKSTQAKGALTTKGSASSAAYYRSVAALMVRACDALHYAHQHGVIHRDIKPSNLMLDADGRVWVTDFGLAQMECEPQLTMTGDIVGTLRYMSPEQALAKRITIDHRTDIYSLGATLYEMLTLQPVIKGQDRQQVLRSIAFDEPQDPRKLRGSVPTDLATIVLKAVQKSPDSRYQSAEDMANDIARYLNHEPIRAKRPRITQQITKWAARHVAAVWALVAVLLVSSIVATTASILVWQSKREADRQAALADQNLDAARDAVRTFLDEISNAQLRYVQQSDTVRIRLMRIAAESYAALMKSSAVDSTGPLLAADMWIDLGEIYRLVGNQRSSVQAFQEAIEVLEGVPPSQREPAHVSLLAYAYRGLAGSIEHSNVTQSLASCHKSEALYRQLAEDGAAIENETHANGGRLNVPLQYALAQLDLGRLMMNNGQDREGIERVQQAHRKLGQLDDPYAALSLAEADLTLAGTDPYRLSLFTNERIDALLPSYSSFEYDENYLWQALDLIDRIHARLTETGHEDLANAVRGGTTGMWRRLAGFYPTAQWIQQKIAEAELARVKAQMNVQDGVRFQNIVDKHLHLTSESPSCRNIELLIELLKIRIRLHETFVQKHETGGHEILLYHRTQLEHAKANLNRWKQRYPVAVRTMPGRAVGIGGPLNDELIQATPAPNGDVYLIGTLNDHAWFDPNDPRTSTEAQVEFLAKYDSGGDYLKHIDLRSVCGSGATSLAVDSNSNTIITGNGYVAKFSPDLKIDWRIEVSGVSGITCDSSGDALIYGDATSPGNTSRMGYVASLSGDNGLRNWTWQFDGDGRELVRCVAVDPEGHILVGGGSAGQTSFTSTSGGEEVVVDFQRLARGTEAFLAKLSPAGQSVWVRPLVGSNSWLAAIVCPDPERIVVALAANTLRDNNLPSRARQLDLDPSRSYEDKRDITTPYERGHVVTYDRHGNVVTRPYSLTGLMAVYPSGICADRRGHIFVTGYFHNRVAFEPGSQYSLKSGFTAGVEIGRVGRTGGYVLELDTQSQYVNHWILSAEDSLSTGPIAIDALGRIVTTGNFPRSLINPTGAELGSAGKQDGYLMILETPEE